MAKDLEVMLPVEKPAPSERELLIQILKLQTMLNSKMFEFLRSYQAQAHWGRDSNMFREGNGSKSRVGRLFDEVNEIGVALTEIVSNFTGERLHEKRDKTGRVLAVCKKCRKETPFAQVIDSPYGMSGAYMSGSERLVCTICKKDSLMPGDDRLPKFNSVFRMG